MDPTESPPQTQPSSLPADGGAATPDVDMEEIEGGDGEEELNDNEEDEDEDEEYEEEDDEEEDEEEEEDEGDEIIAKANALMDKITSNVENPNPIVLHALASLLETEESRYKEENISDSNNDRSPHNIGRLGSLLQENDEFFELISSTFLSELRYVESVQAAAARLLFSCSLTWTYPHVFDDGVLENIKRWAIDETFRSSSSNHNKHGSHEPGRKKSPDMEMLRTYSTGLLAVCLAGGGQVVDDVLTSGLAAELMQYLRVRVLGEAPNNLKDTSSLTEAKNAPSYTSSRSRDESRARLRQVPESSHLEPPRSTDDGFIDVQVAEWDRSITRQTHADGCWDGEEFPDTSIHLDHLEVETDGAEKNHVRDLCGIKGKSVGKSPREEFDEPPREDSARRRVHLGWGKSRGKSRVADGLLENDQAMSSPSSGVRFGGKDNVIKEKSALKNQDPRKTHDVKKSSFSTDPNGISMERDDNDDCFQDCKIGSRDITDLVKKAVRAAEGEARAANGPAEAIKAGGDAAAELVKSAALEEYRRTNDENASVLAASNAASTVVDAANAVELLRNSAGSDGDSKVADPETSEDVEKFFILDSDSLAQLREKFCIQCLIILGEYVEVLGPVLQEKGVDVCLALLQRSSKHKDTSKVSLILSDVLKLINALAAHRTFAAKFVDRGGIQKLLAAPRVAETFLGLSSCLLVIGSIQGIMERVCALPPSIVQQVVELALELLACPQDQARKNAALFFGAAFVFRAVLDAFDSRDGLQKMLSLLHDAASVRSGGSSGSLPGSGSRNDRSPAEVLTSSEKQIAYQTCVALRQYFRAHLILLVDSVRPNKGTRSAAGNIPHSRAAYKPIDISNEAVDSIFRQIQKERKLGLALVRARWSVVDKFISSNGHVTMLELCQAPPVERYLHDLLQYALGVLHIVTLVPYTRKLIVNATVSNGRVGIAIILDAVSGVGNVEPEIIQASLNVLINLVCPPPSISNKPPAVTQEQQTVSNIPLLENSDISTERGASERVTSLTTQNESRERNGAPTFADRSSSAATSSTLVNTSQTSASVSTVGSGLVGDRRISLGAGAGCAGLAAQLEQGYHQAREAVRANYGIKILLQLLQPRIVTPSGSLDCLRALACRVLLGLARDDTIAHILTKLQVGKKLSELIRDSGSTQGNEQNRWQTELVKVAIELIGVVTNSGRTNALAATDAATPALRRIERAAIAAATPITYHSRELLLLIHEHLQASGMADSASLLLKEAQLMPLPSLAAPSSSAQQAYVQETFPVQIQWPSGRTPLGFMSDKMNTAARYGDSHFRCDTARSHWKKKILALPSARGSHLKAQPPVEDSKVSCWSRSSTNVKRSPAVALALESPSVSAIKTCEDMDVQTRTSAVLPMKRKLLESNDTTGLVSSVKRINTGESPVCTTPVTARRSGLSTDQHMFSTPGILKDQQGRLLQGGAMATDADDGNCSSAQRGHMTPSAQHGLLSDSQPLGTERLTLDSIVVQYLKQQHRQCSAPITTLPPLSLLHPHVCPEPHRSLDAPPNVTARLSTREFKNKYGGLYGSRKDRQFVYSRFRPWRTCRDDAGALLTCISFLGDSPQIALGTHTGELKIFDSSSNSVVENYTDHQSPVTMLQSYFSGETQLVLSSTSHDVKLWDSASISAGPRHSFDGRKAARFSNSSTLFAALSSDLSHREVHLYDIQTCQLDAKLTDSASSTPLRGHMHSHVHFSPSDAMVLWDGVLWDRRVSGPIHHFDQFTDYGGGGFHPAGNEVIINSEVWDLRNFRLLRSVPSLDQTMITFNASGNVIYAILRRNLEDVMSAFQTRRVKHPLFSAFRTVDAVTYSDIATIPVDRCVLDFATEPTDSFVGLVTMDDQDEMYSSSRLYEIGRRKPTDDDSDPDDGETDDDEDDEEDDEDDIDEDRIVESDFEGESDADDMSNDEDIFSELEDDDEDDGDFLVDDDGFDGNGIFEFGADDEDEDDSEVVSFSSEDDEEELM